MGGITELKSWIGADPSLVSGDVGECQIVWFGTSSSSAAIEIALRSGCMSHTLFDHDVVGRSNLARTVFKDQDAASGLFKVDALARILREINPKAKVTAIPENILTLPRDELIKHVSSARLVVDMMDSFEARALVNELVVQCQVPALFASHHDKGQGGRIVWYGPGETACYRCASQDRYALAAAGRAEELNLAGVRSLMFDQVLLDMVALRIMFAMLEKGKPTALGRFYKAMEGRNEVAVRCSPEHEWGNALWEAVIGDVLPHQRSGIRDMLCCADTLWMRSRRDPKCPVCSPHWKAVDEASAKRMAELRAACEKWRRPEGKL